MARAAWHRSRPCFRFTAQRGACFAALWSSCARSVVWVRWRVARAILATERDGRDSAAESAGVFIESLSNAGPRAGGLDDANRNPLAAYSDARG